MIDYDNFFKSLRNSLGDAGSLFEIQTASSLKEQAAHGHFDEWTKIIDDLPLVEPSLVELCAAAVRIGLASDCDDKTRAVLVRQLMRFHPWRKGPYDVFGINIDTEWRSDMKWDRLLPHISPLKGRRVLDVGCGNGYHCLRSAGAGARIVVGVEPYLLSVMQFQVVNKYLRCGNVSVLPFGVEDIPRECGCFDTVFSMGLLYHRREPLGHIRELRGFLAKGGELVLETLVVEDDAAAVLKPSDRYAKMRNVWNIPSPPQLLEWLKESGFEEPRIVDVCRTMPAEQRKTEWMTYESLDDFLDPNDKTRTVEGYPAPMRAIAVAKK